MWGDYKAWQKCCKKTTIADAILLFWFTQQLRPLTSKQQLQICSRCQDRLIEQTYLITNMGIPNHRPEFPQGEFCGFRGNLDHRLADSNCCNIGLLAGFAEMSAPYWRQIRTTHNGGDPCGTIESLIIRCFIKYNVPNYLECSFWAGQSWRGERQSNKWCKGVHGAKRLGITDLKD